jgi:hypothetical protein
VIKRGLAAGKRRDVVRRGERLGDREAQRSTICDMARLLLDCGDGREKG